jgi:hypothetical protein
MPVGAGIINGIAEPNNAQEAFWVACSHQDDQERVRHNARYHRSITRSGEQDEEHHWSGYLDRLASAVRRTKLYSPRA